MIPCSHAISAAIKSKMRVETLVSGLYSLECLATAYKDEIFPISNTMNGEHQDSGAVDMEVLRQRPNAHQADRVKAGYYQPAK
ncbi:unnamed protein product [Brassica oleracea]